MTPKDHGHRWHARCRHHTYHAWEWTPDLDKIPEPLRSALHIVAADQARTLCPDPGAVLAYCPRVPGQFDHALNWRLARHARYLDVDETPIALCVNP